MFHNISINPVLELTTDMWDYFMNNGFNVTVGSVSFQLSYGIMLIGSVAISLVIYLIHKIWDW